MKKLITAILSAGVLLGTVPAGAFAIDPLHTFESDGVTYNFVVREGGAEIVSVSGAEGDIALPSELEGYTVTGLGEKAFFGNTAITSVTFPETVTSLGDNAFTGCTSLETAILPDSVSSLGTGCFLSCTALKTVGLSPSVSEIPAECFLSCNSLAVIDLPQKLSRIGERAFFGCTDLKKMVFENSDVSIGSEAIGFYYDLRNDCVSKDSDFAFYAKPTAGVLSYCDANSFPITDIADTSFTGDADLSATLSAADATAVLREYANTAAGAAPTFTALQRRNGDMDRDGMLTAKDASMILSEYANSQK